MEPEHWIKPYTIQTIFQIYPTRVNVFRIIPEFRIFRLTFHRKADFYGKSDSESSFRQILIAFQIYYYLFCHSIWSKSMDF